LVEREFSYREPRGSVESREERDVELREMDRMAMEDAKIPLKTTPVFEEADIPL
jgi:hypothetical protein